METQNHLLIANTEITTQAGDPQLYTLSHLDLRPLLFLTMPEQLNRKEDTNCGIVTVSIQHIQFLVEQ